MATPIAIAACRIMLITPEPVANDDGGRDAVPTAMRVGKVSPTPPRYRGRSASGDCMSIVVQVHACLPQRRRTEKGIYAALRGDFQRVRSTLRQIVDSAWLHPLDQVPAVTDLHLCESLVQRSYFFRPIQLRELSLCFLP